MHPNENYTYWATGLGVCLCMLGGLRCVCACDVCVRVVCVCVWCVCACGVCVRVVCMRVCVVRVCGAYTSPIAPMF